MDLRVGEHQVTEAVKQAQRIPGQRVVRFQERDADGHVQLSGQSPEGLDEIILGRKRQAIVLFPVRDPVARRPHFRKLRDVSAA